MGKLDFFLQLLGVHSLQSIVLPPCPFCPGLPRPGQQAEGLGVCYCVDLGAVSRDCLHRAYLSSGGYVTAEVWQKDQDKQEGFAAQARAHRAQSTDDGAMRRVCVTHLRSCF